MLLSLNDDCLLYICEFLNFSDQSSLAHACQRLQTIIEHNWSHRYKNVILDYKECAWFHEQEQYFKEFMQCICGNVEQLVFGKLTSSTFYLLNELDFPKTTVLSMNGCYTTDDADTQLIVKLFPQLEKLTFCSINATGRYLWNLKNLNELSVGGCEELDTKYFKKIFSTLRLRKLDIMYHGYNTCFDELAADIAECTTLEEIIIDDHHMLLLLKELPKLKKLKKLIVYTRDYDTYLLEEIVKRYANLMETIIFDDVFWSHEEHCESVKNMRNLRRLLMHDDDFENEQILRIGKSLASTLQEFRFVEGRLNEDREAGLIELLSCCKNLEIFDISECKLDANFLRKMIAKLSVDFKNRKNPLKICCFGTNVTNEDAELLTIPNCLEISLAKENTVFPGTRCFQCEWRLPEA